MNDIFWIIMLFIFGLFMCFMFDNSDYKCKWARNNPFSRTCKVCGRTYNQYQDQWSDGHSNLYWDEVCCNHKDIPCDCQKTVSNRVDWVTWVINRMS